jgi:small subunit ribosomal protein S35
VRYNPATGIIKLSSENFEAPAQNKRYLGDTISRLIAEARNSDDLFEDIPLDLRHAKITRKPIFPENWKVTAERGRELKIAREEQMLLDEGSNMQEKPAVDGADAVYEYVRSMGRPALSGGIGRAL